MSELIASALIVAGALIASIAAIGLLRFPDVLNRMHAASKPQTLGLIMMALGVAVHVRSLGLSLLLLVVVLAQLLTVPASSAMVGRAAFRRGFVVGGQYVIDELTPRLATDGEPDEDNDGFIDNFDEDSGGSSGGETGGSGVGSSVETGGSVGGSSGDRS